MIGGWKVPSCGAGAGVAAYDLLLSEGYLNGRHGSGTYIAEGPPQLDSRPLSLLASLHGFTPEQMFEARRVLGLAPEELDSLRRGSDGSSRGGKKLSLAASKPVQSRSQEIFQIGELQARKLSNF